MVCRGSNSLCDGEWSDGFQSKFWSGDLEGKVPCIKIHKISQLVVVRLLNVLVIGVLVFVLSIQQNLLEFLPDFPETREELISLWNSFYEGQLWDQGWFISMEHMEGGDV